MSWIETFEGGRFDFDKPDESEINIKEIIVSLSRTARYNGHTAYMYTVGQHCVLMERALLRERPNASALLRLHVLLHDAAEAYTGDMNRPLKYRKGMEEFRVIEDMVQSTIYKQLDIPQPTPEEYEIVKEYDDRMLRTEAEALMCRVEDWRDVIQLRPLPVAVEPWIEFETTNAFTSSYLNALKDYRSEQKEHEHNRREETIA